jgi:hypothetical protein
MMAQYIYAQSLVISLMRSCVAGIETLMSVPIATRFAPLSLLVPCDLRDVL